MSSPADIERKRMHALQDKRQKELRRLLPDTDYVDFQLGDETVCLDGHFTAKELAVILSILHIKE